MYAYQNYLKGECEQTIVVECILEEIGKIQRLKALGSYIEGGNSEVLEKLCDFPLELYVETVPELLELKR